MELVENASKTPKTYEELREQIAKMLFHQATYETDWELRIDSNKDAYRKNADEILNLIKKAGWILKPNDQSLPQS